MVLLLLAAAPDLLSRPADSSLGNESRNRGENYSQLGPITAYFGNKEGAFLSVRSVLFWASVTEPIVFFSHAIGQFLSGFAQSVAFTFARSVTAANLAHEIRAVATSHITNCISGVYVMPEKPPFH